MFVILWQVKTNSTVAQNIKFSLKQPCILFQIVIAVPLPTPARMLLFLAMGDQDRAVLLLSQVAQAQNVSFIISTYIV